MLHEGLVWKISTGGASPLRGAGLWRSYSDIELPLGSSNFGQRDFGSLYIQELLLKKSELYDT